MEENANKNLFDIAKFLIRKAVPLAGKFIAFVGKKSFRKVKGYEVGSVKKFAKKYPNAGGLEIKEYDDKERFEYIKKTAK